MGEIEEWRDQIYLKLYSVFSDDIESFVRVQYYLDQVDKEYKDSGEIPPALRTLKLSLNSDHMFKTYATRLADDTKTAENDPNFRKTMDLMWNRILKASDESFDESTHQCFDIARLADNDKLKSHFSQGFARAWHLIPVANRQQIISVIPKIINNRALMGSIDEVVGLFDKVGGSIVMVALAAVALGYDVIKNIRRWWAGEITGVRCLKNIVDGGVSIAAGVGGGVAGAAVGSIVGPLGTLIGGVVGGIVVGQAANYLIDRLTQSIFGIPKEEALENAYNYFGVSADSSNHDINISYRNLCLRHHPDKGGKQEDFQFVQYTMAIIKEARGELY